MLNSRLQHDPIHSSPNHPAGKEDQKLPSHWLRADYHLLYDVAICEVLHNSIFLNITYPLCLSVRYLHLRLDLSTELLQLILADLLLWPSDSQSLLFVWLWNNVEMDLYVVLALTLTPLPSSSYISCCVTHESMDGL